MTADDYLFTGDAATDAATLTRYSHDASLFEVRPHVIMYPKSTQDIQALVQYVNARPKERLSLTVRSGGTDMTGGPLGESIIVDVNKHLNHIKSFQGEAVTVEPGMFYRDFEAITLKHHLLLPSYPASREICTVGGMVANNAGGEKTLSYGKTEKYVRGLKVVLRDGQEHSFGPLTRVELDRKMAKQDFEGTLYRELFTLIDSNYEVLQRAKPVVSKNSAGYALWDVWDQQTFDVTKLFVGSQGTLGIISEITFNLIKPKPHAQMLVIFLRDTKHLAQVIKHTLPYAPETFESYDDHTLKMAIRFLPGLWRQMKTRNLLGLLLSFLPEVKLLLTGGLPKLVLLAEFTGHDPVEIRQRAQAAQAALRQFKLPMRRTRSSAEMSKYWTIRRESFNLLRHHIHDKRTAPFIDDIVVRPEQLPEFLPQLDAIMQEYELTYTIAGHVGDANFHIIPLMDVTKPETATIIKELGDKVYELVLKFGGSISGEHNDGLIRSHYLPTMYGQVVYGLFEQVKHLFDPDNIFNPGKKVGASWDYASKHLAKE